MEIKKSELKQIIKEEILRFQKIEELNFKKEQLEEQIFVLEEKWGVTDAVSSKEKGKYNNWTLADLRSERSKLKAKKERTPAESGKLKELNFAIRAKTGWGKVTEESDVINEKPKSSTVLTSKKYK